MIGPRKTIHSDMTYNAFEGGAQWGGALADVPGIRASGLTAGTLVATSQGWRAVETIAEGDNVLTFDHGMQPVTGIQRTCLWAPVHVGAEAPQVSAAQGPLFVPAGALGNTTDMLVLPHQSVMLESESAVALFGDPFTLVPASALEGFNGVRRIAPQGPVRVTTLMFERDQVIYANVAALLYCPANSEHAGGGPSARAQAMQMQYRALPVDEAEFLVDCIMAEAEEAALWQAPAQKLQTCVA